MPLPQLNRLWISTVGSHRWATSSAVASVSWQPQVSKVLTTWTEQPFAGGRGRQLTFDNPMHRGFKSLALIPLKAWSCLAWWHLTTTL